LKGYSTADVARILELTPRQVRASVHAGLLEPGRGSRGEFRFSFQDLVFLKTARGLFAARIPRRRVREILERLRGQLPVGRRLGGVRIAVEGKRVVVSDGSARWQPESGQALFDFGIADLARRAAPVARRAFSKAKEEEAGTLSAEQWYRWGCELEAAAPEEAAEAYRRALAIDAGHADAHVNLGRLLHEAGDAGAAHEHYRRALDARPEDATAAFNMGVALEDLGRPADALAAYEKAVALDPQNADAHYNAANLCESLGRPADALRHLKDYRALTLGRPR
jgi:tetratricopeptide (TPR) repeat protein